MTILPRKRKPLGLLLLTGCLATTGCKTTSWSPTSMFAWNRGSDVSALAESEEAGMPQSPAAKYEPGAIASVGAKNQAEATGETAGDPASAYGYTTENPALAGLAAEANGYATGPYEVSSPTAGMAAAGSQASMPNPYGGAYGGGAVTTPPDIALPKATQEALAQQQAAGMSAYPGAQLPSSPTNPQNSMSAAYTSGGEAGVPSYPALPGGATYPASATMAPGNLPLPGESTTAVAPTTAYQGAQAPATGSAPAYPTKDSSATGLPPIGENAAPINRYAPGTTGRSTNYNFSTPTSK